MEFHPRTRAALMPRASAKVKSLRFKHIASVAQAAAMTKRASSSHAPSNLSSRPIITSVTGPGLVIRNNGRAPTFPLIAYQKGKQIPGQRLGALISRRLAALGSPDLAIGYLWASRVTATRSLSRGSAAGGGLCLWQSYGAAINYMCLQIRRTKRAA